jgi:hypothetical protein
MAARRFSLSVAVPARPSGDPEPMTAAPWAVEFLAVPVLFLLAGIGLRYAAYMSVNPIASPQGFADAMCVWDCFWYGDIARHGYQAYPEVLNFGGPGGIANWAFFPLYPLLLAALGWVLPFNPAMLGAILSPLLTFAAVLAGRPLFAESRRGYFLFAALLLCGPLSFYFATAYSESLFLLLTVLAFVALGRRNYGAAGVFGALLAATRTVGVLFVFAVAVNILSEFRAWRRPWRVIRPLLGRPDMVFAIFAVPVGIFAFTIWLHVTTGDSLAFVHIQRGWDRHFVNPVMAVWHGLTGRNDRMLPLPQLAATSLAGLILSGVLAARRQWAEALFCALSILLALLNGLESMIRFVAALAPLYAVLALELARYRPLFWLTLLACFGLDYWLTIPWLNQHGALM